MVHEWRIETRPATCCDQHTDSWLVCSCGHEQNCGHGMDEVTRSLTAHRLVNIEEQLGIKYKQGDMTHVRRAVA